MSTSDDEQVNGEGPWNGLNILIDTTPSEHLENVSVAYRCSDDANESIQRLIHDIEAMVFKFMPFWIHTLAQCDPYSFERDQAIVWAMLSLPIKSSDGETVISLGNLLREEITFESGQIDYTIPGRQPGNDFPERSKRVFSKTDCELTESEASVTDDIHDRNCELLYKQEQVYHNCDWEKDTLSSYCLSQRNDLLVNLEEVISTLSALELNRDLGETVLGEDMVSILGCSIYGIFASLRDTVEARPKEDE